jgi:predicted ABC-type transport system involved in lysophospholipase L1 biosynthesis ATPase subunit
VTPAILEISGVSKDFHGLRPLRVHRLTVASSDHVAIVGFDQPSAEIFVNLVTGATLPDAGTVHLFGRSTAAIADSAEWLTLVDRVGIVSPRAVLLDRLTVIQNLAMPFTLEIEPPADDIRDRARRLAEEVGMAEDTWTQSAGALDAASRARIRLGRALALDPGVLLLEHASAGLAREATTPFAAAVRGIAARRGIALVVVTADETFASAAAPRVLTWEPATGRLTDRRRRAWFGRRLG